MSGENPARVCVPGWEKEREKEEGEGEQERVYPVTGVDTLGADHEKVTSLFPAEAWKFSADSRGTV